MYYAYYINFIFEYTVFILFIYNTQVAHPILKNFSMRIISKNSTRFIMYKSKNLSNIPHIRKLA